MRMSGLAFSLSIKVISHLVVDRKPTESPIFESFLRILKVLFRLELSSQMQDFVKKDFFRAFPTEALPWPAVKKRGNAIDIVLCNVGK